MDQPVFTQLKIVGITPTKLPFRLDMSFMHGDADGYTDATWYFDTEEALAKAWRDLRTFDVYMQKYKYEFGDKAEQRFIAEVMAALGWTEDEVSNYKYETYPHDHTNDDHRAQLCGEAGYATIGGIEYQVNLI